ncbi:MAG: DUF3341 domain-containing protein [Proteobacteria bacterium]|jgi:hypothetical protein|nr:DUF3341 domain-containing protein [Pseudomonadota bacterium]
MSTAGRGHIKGVYEHLDCLMTAVGRLKGAGFNDFEVLTPFHQHEIDELLFRDRPSPVRWWTLTGSLLGALGGILLTSLSHLQWGHTSGGMPVIAIPPFAVITFECTILVGALATFAGMLIHSGLPALGLDKPLKDSRMTDTSFGIVFLAANADDIPQIREVLTNSGAVEVTGDESPDEVANE